MSQGEDISDEVGVSNQIELPAVYSSGLGQGACFDAHPVAAIAGKSDNVMIKLLKLILWVMIFMELELQFLWYANLRKV